MQTRYPPRFEREMGCTEAEWLGWLPGACGARSVDLAGDATAQVSIGEGVLDLNWSPLPDRQIALMRLPRLSVNFSFTAVDEADRERFMRYFDLFMQRGGG
jgi:hypothetical protein